LGDSLVGDVQVLSAHELTSVNVRRETCGGGRTLGREHWVVVANYSRKRLIHCALGACGSTIGVVSLLL
jgi:hypothetical protein